jgi:hypothetical protein
MIRLTLVALLLTGCMPSSTQGDFVCSMQGADTLVIEGAKITQNGRHWYVQEGALSYMYVQRPGELCTVERLP